MASAPGRVMQALTEPAELAGWAFRWTEYGAPGWPETQPLLLTVDLHPGGRHPGHPYHSGFENLPEAIRPKEYASYQRCWSEGDSLPGLKQIIEGGNRMVKAFDSVGVPVGEMGWAVADCSTTIMLRQRDRLDRHGQIRRGKPVHTGITVQVEKCMAARPEKVFQAWTRPDLLARWWGPGAEAQVDLRVGGRFRLAMSLPSGPLVARGIYREVAENQRLVFTWNWEGSDEPDSLVTVLFSPAEGGTRVLITHQANPSAEVAEGHRQGWSDCVDRLVALSPEL